MYINTHTYYSLRYGTFSPYNLLELAKKNGVSSFVLTDINNTSAALHLLREAHKYGIRPLFGIDFRNGIKQCFIGIAKNNKGYQEINTYLSTFLTNKTETPTGHKEIPNSAPPFDSVFVIYPFNRDKKRILKPNEYIGFTPFDLDYIRYKKIDTSRGVILQTVTFRNKQDFNAHRLLRSIDQNTLLSKLPQSEQSNPEHKMIPEVELIALYTDFPDIIKNTAHIFESSTIDFDVSEDAPPQNQKTYTDSVEKDDALLMELCQKGIKYRYPKLTDIITKRIKKELKAIKTMGFVSYFLMNWDIITYAQQQDYYYVGRGSGANSVVAYLLRITDVDPIELDLYFERFINQYRTNPPDFDIDFSWKDRDDITRYIFERFDNVALVATYNTFQQRGVRRQLGKVFGLPKHEIDKLTKGHFQIKHLDHLSLLVLKYSNYIHGFPSHLSIHASGIIVAEKPIHHFSPTFMPPKGYPTIQFDMHIAEDVGLYKFDILSQRGLGKIKDAITIINENRTTETKVDIHDISRFKEDENIKTILRNADAIGCFYVESPAMRMLLKKLQVDTYLGLVAASSVIRPGVAQSGMMQQYILRYRNPSKRKDAHPTLLELMPETYGVMVYQEDVIKVAHHFAGLTLGEADKMRRGMSGKYRSRAEFDAVKQKFFSNCKEKGHSLPLTTEIWRQTESFAGYAFAKGHSASYAVESYQCLFLKCYYPLEFMVATINNYGGFYSTELYVLEAKTNGGIIHPPCVNKSNWDTKLYGKDIYLGFHLLLGFERNTTKRILIERNQNGVFIDFNDFLNRVVISLEQISTLIRIDVFKFTLKNKRTLLWEAHLKLGKMTSKKLEDVKHNAMQDLFRIEQPEYDIPDLENSLEEDTFDQMELLGFPLHSAFKLLREQSNSGYVSANNLINYVQKIVWVKGYLIHAKHTQTKSGQHMFFGTLLDENGHWIDTVHFPPISTKYIFRGKGIYRIKGKVLEEYDSLNIEVLFMEKMDIIEDPRYSEVQEEVKRNDVVTRNRKVDYFK
jgi:DNA polymerase-3 subunit alpha